MCTLYMPSFLNFKIKVSMCADSDTGSQTDVVQGTRWNDDDITGFKRLFLQGNQDQRARRAVQ